jgi:hypothetical protein
MNDIEKAINVISNLKHLIINIIGNEINEKEFDTTISALEKQLNGGWIPVSERLPEKEDIYQVTIKYKNFAGIHLTVRTAIYENEKWNIHGPQPVISNRKIIAWQPLPEPYKEVENE